MHGETAPGLFVALQLVGVDFVIQQAAFAAHQVGVKVVGLEAVDDRVAEGLRGAVRFPADAIPDPDFLDPRQS